MTVAEFDNKDQIQQGTFQHIRSRIKNTLNLPIDNLGKSTGAPTNPPRHVRSTVEPKDDLVSVFKRMLDLGSPEYEHGWRHSCITVRQKWSMSILKKMIDGNTKVNLM